MCITLELLSLLEYVNNAMFSNMPWSIEISLTYIYICSICNAGDSMHRLSVTFDLALIVFVFIQIYEQQVRPINSSSQMDKTITWYLQWSDENDTCGFTRCEIKPRVQKEKDICRNFVRKVIYKECEEQRRYYAVFWQIHNKHINTGADPGFS